MYAEHTVFVDLAHAFSHQFKNKWSMIYKIDHIAKNDIIIHSNNYCVANNFVMKCIETIYFFIILCGIGPKNMYIFSCECPFKLTYLVILKIVPFYSTK